MPGFMTNDNNMGCLKHLYIKQQAVQANTLNPSMQNGAAKGCKNKLA